MNKERLMTILLGPHVSEKSTSAADKNRQYVFKVLPDATKKEVKNAVEMLFNVEVNQVTTIKMKGKTKQFKQKTGRRSDWKKAFVSLADGHDIQFAGVE